MPAGGVLDGPELFDAAFFGVSPREAELMDPQHRLFLECAWEALEAAGYDPQRTGGTVGVFAGASKGDYLLVLGQSGALSEPDRQPPGAPRHRQGLPDDPRLLQAGPRGAEPRRADRLLDLARRRPPRLPLLLARDCDLALAGGVSITAHQRRGYIYTEGDVLSPDGHCRSFDAGAAGSVDSDGAAVLVLKRLADALADGDRVRAVIRGSGDQQRRRRQGRLQRAARRGQARLIARHAWPAPAWRPRRSPTSKRTAPARRSATRSRSRPCTRRSPAPAGSASAPWRRSRATSATLNAAAGAIGLIKAVLALEHRQIPPTLHVERPNPGIDLATSPFFLNTELRDWDCEGPRRVGVSSFGVGGTNAHVILEEAPGPEPASPPARPWQLLPLSARTPAALEAATAALAGHLERHPEIGLADAAWTLQVGRRPFEHRRIAVCRDHGDAVQALETVDARAVATRATLRAEPPVVFLFPGQGAQHAGMGAGLYAEEPAFRAGVDRCCEILEPHLGRDLRELLVPLPGTEARAAAELGETALTQPALFTVEHALARTLMGWGIVPRAMLGHSLGEYVAACLAGVLSLEDALALVAARGRLIQSLPPGAMLAVPLPAAEIAGALGPELALAAVNGEARSVVSGPAAAVAALQERLARRGVACRRLPTSHAFHSSMMDPILDRFRAEVERLALRAPSIPYLSNLTGTWIRPEEATSPDYWVRHLRETVQLAAAAAELAGEAPALVEVGPGKGLGNVVRRPAAAREVVAAMPGDEAGLPEAAALMLAVGRLWTAGVAVDWPALHENERRRRVTLPTYPFERKRYWVDGVDGVDGVNWLDGVAGVGPPAAAAEPTEPPRAADMADWFYVPTWTPSALASSDDGRDRSWLLLLDDGGLGGALADRLAARGHAIVTVTEGPELARFSDRAWALDPRRAAHWQALLAELDRAGGFPSEVVHLANLTGGAALPHPQAEARSFHGPLALAQALAGAAAGRPGRLTFVADRLLAVTPTEAVEPDKALLLGPLRVGPQRFPGLAFRAVDLEAGLDAEAAADLLVGEMVNELAGAGDEPAVAWRAGRRWVEGFAPVRLPAGEGRPPALRERGVYLVTGGLGGIGLVLAEHLATACRARLVLVRRRPFPERGEWTERLRAQAGNGSGGDGGEEDATATTIRRLLAMEAAGAEVLVLAADVTDPAQMDEVRRAAEERFGAVHGIVHSAGVGSGETIDWSAPAAAAAVLAPKTRGTRVVAAAFDDVPLDLFVISASQASVLGGGIGQVDYSAANAFADAWVQARSAAGWPTLAVAIGWATWREVGLGLRTVLGEVGSTRERRLASAISSREGQRSSTACCATASRRSSSRRSRSPRSSRRAATGGSPASSPTATCRRPPRRPRRPQRGGRPTAPPAPPMTWSAASSRSGATSCASARSAPTTTSSPSAATP